MRCDGMVDVILDDIPVVLGRDVDPAGADVFDGVIGTAVQMSVAALRRRTGPADGLIDARYRFL